MTEGNVKLSPHPKWTDYLKEEPYSVVYMTNYWKLDQSANSADFIKNGASSTGYIGLALDANTVKMVKTTFYWFPEFMINDLPVVYEEAEKLGPEL